MYAEYKRDVSHNYLILREEEKVNTASYQVRMLTGNVIPWTGICYFIMISHPGSRWHLFMNRGNFTEKICTCFFADLFV